MFDDLQPTVYAPTCTDCAFETSVEGDFHDAFDAADAHRQSRGDAPTEHFLNLEPNGASR